MSNKESTVKKNKLWASIKKNLFTIVMVIFIGLMIVSPDAKSFVLRQLISTGLFNASIDKKTKDNSNHINVDFDYSDEGGMVLNTAELRGKVVFINFWASWCPPCRAEFPSIEKLYSKFKTHPDIVFLTINEDSDLSIGKSYLEKENFSLPIFKANGYVPEQIYSGTLPTTVVLDKNGKIRFHQKGFANYASDKFVNQVEEMLKE